MRKSPDAMGADPLAYSIEGFCASSGLRRSYVYLAIARGELEARKAGRRTVILRDAGQRYLAGLPPSRSSLALSSATEQPRSSSA